MPIQLSLPGVQTPEQTEMAELEDAFARMTIELCELMADYAETLECLIEAIEWAESADKTGDVLPDNIDRWKKATEITCHKTPATTG